MDKPTPSTSIKHNDGYSKALIESYAQWMDGAGFQGSAMEEQVPAPGAAATIEKPTEEDKVTTPIGTIPKPAFDTETIPTLKVVNTDDGSTKDPKFNAGPPDSTKNKSSYGAQIKNIMIKKEEKEVQTEQDTKQPQSKDSCPKCGATPCQEHAVKGLKKEDFDAKQSELWDEAAKILTELSELTETTYTVTGEKWDVQPADAADPDKEAKAPEMEESYKAKARKTAEKILKYSKK